MNNHELMIKYLHFDFTMFWSSDMSKMIDEWVKSLKVPITIESTTPIITTKSCTIIVWYKENF